MEIQINPHLVFTLIANGNIYQSIFEVGIYHLKKPKSRKIIKNHTIGAFQKGWQNTLYIHPWPLYYYLEKKWKIKNKK